ncbi:MAG: hypothetical protein PHC64_04480 [Candidatus Gastranaerophilales bacterium]|nr:hypothetical protein [Candidatus Gastranaerophilales bacterium]
MQILNNIYNVGRVNYQNHLGQKYQINPCLTDIKTDTFMSSKHNNSNIGLVNFCGLAHPLKINSLEKMFQELYEFNGDNVEFAQLAFRKVRDYLGLADVFTKDLSIVDLSRPNASKRTIAKFFWFSGDMGLDEEALKTSSRASILGYIRHEFEHYLQNEKMMRSEDIGIERFIELDNQKALKAHKEALFEAQMPSKSCMSDEEFIEFKTSRIDRDFWGNVIAKRGVIKSGTPEADEALKYLDAHLSYPEDAPYIEYYNEFCDIPLKHPDYLMFIKPYRDEKNHYDYYTSILETNARNVENDIRKQYQEFVAKKTGQQSPTVEEKEPFNLQELIKIKRFDEIFEQKFGKYNLPENFKAYMYTLIGYDVHYDTSEINNKLLNLTREDILSKLDLYEIFLEKGQVNMRSQEELDCVNRFITEYRTENPRYC